MLSQIQAAAIEPKHWQAAAWILERLIPERYSLRRVELTGRGGGPIRTEVTFDAKLEQLSIEDLRRLARGNDHEPSQCS